MEAFFKQFLCNLKTNFPNAQLRLFAYSSQREYCNNICVKNLPNADVIAAIDILGPKDKNNYSHGNYTKLCLKTLEKNPNLMNCILDIDGKKMPQLTSISLNEINENSVKINNSSGDKTYGYLNTPSMGSIVAGTLKALPVAQISTFLLTLSHTTLSR